MSNHRTFLQILRWFRRSGRITGKPETIPLCLRSPVTGKFGPGRAKLVKTPFLGNLATARCAGQVSESATTWQIFRKIEYAAGMPQDILSAAKEQAEQSDPQALQWVSPQRALRLASSIGG